MISKLKVGDKVLTLPGYNGNNNAYIAYKGTIEAILTNRVNFPDYNYYILLNNGRNAYFHRDHLKKLPKCIKI